MEELIVEFQQKLTTTSLDFERYLVSEIDLNNQLIALKGARGSGKTTVLIQIAKKFLSKEKTLYVSLDHIYFFYNKLYNLAKEFINFDGKYLLLDEVHKYPNWSREIKLINDNFPKLKVIFTSSSMLEIYKCESDLSRRAVSYNLKELSFREFIEFETEIKFTNYSFENILNSHTEIALQVLDKLKPLPLFAKYLQIGAYPFYKENKKTISINFAIL